MLNESVAQKYWEDRADKLKAAAVGFADKDLAYQNEQYKQTSDFIFSHIPHCKNNTVLDYGCGIGRYAKFFKHYVGVDMTKELISIAKQNNPNKEFIHITKPFLTEIVKTNHIDYIFTATVLQHCSDELVLKIMKSWENYLSPDEIFLYENSMSFEKPHVKGRRSYEYTDMLLDAGFDVSDVNSFSHELKGEMHTLTVCTIG